MTGCNYMTPAEEIARRKTVSDEYSDTSNLTRGDTNNNSRAAAYKSSREVLDAKEIRELEAATDTSDLMKELDLMERELGR